MDTQSPRSLHDIVETSQCFTESSNFILSIFWYRNMTLMIRFLQLYTVILHFPVFPNSSCIFWLLEQCRSRIHMLKRFISLLYEFKMILLPVNLKLLKSNCISILKNLRKINVEVIFITRKGNITSICIFKKYARIL